LKEDIAALQKRYDRLRDKAARVMRDTDTLSEGKYQLRRTVHTSTRLSKDSVPRDVWERYARESTVVSYRLKKL